MAGLLVSKILWLVLNFSFSNAVRVKRNSLAPLSNLTPEEQNFNSFTLDNALYNPSRTYTSLSSLPSSCSSALHTNAELCPTEKMQAVNVTYDDCWDSWTLCYCISAPNVTLDEAVDRLGKVPVGLRKYITTTVVLPAHDLADAHAYTLTNGDVYFFGDLDIDTWVHEATHAYDYAFGDPISGSQEWLDAIKNDTCATDVYGITNAAEEFAQSAVLKIYSLIYGSLPPGWNESCMSHQQNWLGSLPLYDKTTLFGGTCASNGTLYNDGLSVVRPIKSNGPLQDPNAPLRMYPNANSSRSPVNRPPSVADGRGNKNSSLSLLFSCSSIWTLGSLSLAIVFIFVE